MKYCCEEFKEEKSWETIEYSKAYGEWHLMAMGADGDTRLLILDYCPFCGAKLK